MKFRLNKKELLVIQSSILTLSILATGCSNLNETSSTLTAIDTTPTTSITSVETTIPVETTETTEMTINYNLNWDQYDSEVFDEYFTEKIGYGLAQYIYHYGYTDELNTILTEYINNKYSTNYDSVPFSEVNYFYRFLRKGWPNFHLNEYEWFEYRYLSHDEMMRDSFSNKLILSYLVLNHVEFGKRIDKQCLIMLNDNPVEIMGSHSYFVDHAFINFGNDSSIKYTNDEMLFGLALYNSYLTQLSLDLRIKSGDVKDSPEDLEMVNGFLRQFYGDNAPQIGEVITREQYVAIFGEEPIDLSYIPGAIVDQNSDSDESYSRSR